jgi:hypothetical protein
VVGPVGVVVPFAVGPAPRAAPLGSTIAPLLVVPAGPPASPAGPLAADPASGELSSFVTRVVELFDELGTSHTDEMRVSPRCGNMASRIWNAPAAHAAMASVHAAGPSQPGQALPAPRRPDGFAAARVGPSTGADGDPEPNTTGSWARVPRLPVLAGERRSAGPVTDPACSPRPLVTIGPWC